jgi:hypothetical protein
VWSAVYKILGIKSRDLGAPRKYKPLPPGIDISIQGIAVAWVWFQKVDADDSGKLDCNEVKILGKSLGLNWNKARLKQAYDEMTESHAVAPDGAGKTVSGVSFHEFAGWWSRHRAASRREMRRTFRCAATPHRRLLNRTAGDLK